MSDTEKAGEKSQEDTDKELSDLLDSALADFSKNDKPEVTEKTSEADSAVADVAGQEWSDDFIRQAAEQFESNIAALLAGGDETVLSPDQVQSSFQRMAEAAQQALVNPGVSDPTSNDFASTITQTIQGLTQGAETLQNPFSESDIMNMFSGMAGNASDSNAFLPFMQGMMQSLLSKEVLYPSLKDIIEKYPGWLQENEDKLTLEDKARYLKQQELMQQVCNELETETQSDSADVRKVRFDKVLRLMQTLQDHGQPPSEIVATDSSVPFDQVGNPEQCSIM